VTLAPPSMMVDLRVNIGGTDLSGDARRSLVEIRVRHVASRPSVADVVLSGDTDLTADITPGAPLEARLGDVVHMSGDVASIHHHLDASGGHLVRVRAYDRLARLRRRQTIRALPEGDLLTIVRSIASDAGLDVSSAGTWPRLGHLHQFRENDLATLVALADLYGAAVVVRGTTLHLVGSEGLGDEVHLQLGADLVDLTHGRTDEDVEAVRAWGWDHERGETMRVESASAVATSGPAEPSSTDAVRDLRDIGAPGVEAATAQANAVAERARSRATTFRALATNRSDLHVGQVCAFRDVGGGVIGRHRLELVDHRATGEGLVTEVSSRAPRRRRASSTTGIARGHVVDVADPESRGRVTVTLPTYGDATTPWIDVVHPGGSGGHGFVAVPAVGDVVAVLVVEGDLSRSVALGGLLGTDGPARDVVADGDVVRHTWHSDPDQYVVLDSAESTVAIRNRSGSRVTLAPDQVEVHAACDLVLAAPGHRITIRAAAVDFEQLTEAEEVEE
jgi:phage protein D/phage baseplate assembly protein gpV